MSPLAENQTLSNQLSHTLQLLETEKNAELSNYLETLHPVEKNTLINSAPEESKSAIIKHINGLDQLSQFIAYANQQTRELTLRLLDEKRIAAIVRRLEVDDAADLVGGLERRKQLRILKRLGIANAKELGAVLEYNNETAGGIMTTLFVSLLLDTTVKDTINYLRKDLSSEKIDPNTSIYNIYLLDKENKLVGVCSLRQILSAQPEARLSDFMETNIIYVHPEDDQEKVASIISDYNFSSIPVISENSEILGIVTVDDVLDVVEEEYTEDILKIGGTDEEDIIGASAVKSFKSRLPWLLASWIGGILAAYIIGIFETTISDVVSLAFFMPLVLLMGGNVGAQSSTITVCGIVTGELGSQTIYRRLKKELLVGLALGITFAILLSLFAYLSYGNYSLGLVVGSSILCVMCIAAGVGSMLPIIFKKFDLDPAVASGPLVYMSTDLLSITIYFSVASLLL